jgi:hypothetical protein
MLPSQFSVCSSSQPRPTRSSLTVLDSQTRVCCTSAVPKLRQSPLTDSLARQGHVLVNGRLIRLRIRMSLKENLCDRVRKTGGMPHRTLTLFRNTCNCHFPLKTTQPGVTRFVKPNGPFRAEIRHEDSSESLFRNSPRSTQLRCLVTKQACQGPSHA